MIECKISKIIKWAFENEIEIKVSKAPKIEGQKEMIMVVMNKHGKEKNFKMYDWDEIDNKWLSDAIENLAFDLCLTRLVL